MDVTLVSSLLALKKHFPVESLIFNCQSDKLWDLKNSAWSRYN